MSDFQAESTRQGETWEQAVTFVLQAQGWEVTDNNTRRAGIEIDIVAISPDGVEHWIECKGSHRGKVPGMKRHDTVRKALFSGYHLLHALPERPPYVIVTSHVADTGVTAQWIDRALSSGAIDAVWSLTDIESGATIQ